MKYALIVLLGVVIFGAAKIFKRPQSTEVIWTYHQSQLEALLAQLLTTSTGLAFADILGFINDRKVFFNDNPEIFEDYFLAESELKDSMDLILIILKHHMIFENNLEMIDWKELNEETFEKVNSLMRSKSLNEISISEGWGDLEPFEFLNLCGELVRNDSCYTLLELGRGTDALEIFLVLTERVDQILDLSKSLDFSISILENEPII